MHKITQQRVTLLEKRVNLLFNIDIKLSVSYDLKGSCVIGQCKKIKDSSYLIRLHDKLLSCYKLTYLDDVLYHEVAHAVQMQICNINVKPHGKEWKVILETIENRPYIASLRPKYTYFLNNIKRIKKRYKYVCNCPDKHFLTQIRHNRNLKGIKYRCRKCKSILKYSPA